MTSNAQWIREAIRFGVDQETGTVIEQITSDAVTSTNIYCEQRYTSADGSRIALSRKPFGQPQQIWVFDLTTMRQCFAAQGEVLGANASQNAIYLLNQQNDKNALMRLDLMDCSLRTIMDFDPKRSPRTGAVSPDEKYLLGGPFEEPGDNMFSMYLFDLQTGETKCLCTAQDMSNPHAQFDPAGSGLSILQINRMRKRVIPGLEGRWPGATLNTLDSSSGTITALPAGRPHTPLISGHECWAGNSGNILFTAGQYDVTTTSHVTYKTPHEAERDMPAAAIYQVRPGDTVARVVAEGKLWNHLAASDDGQYFIGDDHQTGRIYIGSIATGKHLGICESQTRQGVCQYSHVHAYMTPDNGWIIFTSIVTGIAQVYAAKIPDGFLNQLS